MGAYYMACVGKTRYCTHELGNGLKLMEHSYLNNNYCEAIEWKLLNKKKSLVWLCDYHEKDMMTELTWNNTKEGSIKEAPDTYTEHSPVKYIINHSIQMYFEKQELSKLLENEEWMIHPLPILTNSDDGAMGGGDYHEDDSRRGTWCGHTIEVRTSDVPSSYKNITKDCIFKER